MITFEKLEKMALSFPEVDMQPHFEKSSFRVKNKIFISIEKNAKRACVKLSEIDQHVFLIDGIVYPVDNKWGKRGWTYIELRNIKPELFEDMLTTAYCEVAPLKLARLVRPDKENK